MDMGLSFAAFVTLLVVSMVMLAIGYHRGLKHTAKDLDEAVKTVIDSMTAYISRDALEGIPLPPPTVHRIKGLGIGGGFETFGSRLSTLMWKIYLAEHTKRHWGCIKDAAGVSVCENHAAHSAPISRDHE